MKALTIPRFACDRENPAVMHLAEHPVTKVDIKDVHFYYGAHQALRAVCLDVHAQRVTALIGPSGCGKSTFLRVLNRMNDTIPGTRLVGTVRIDGEDIYRRDVDVVDLRKRVGMVFQRSNPFPQSIYENIAYGLRIHGLYRKRSIAETVEMSLQHAGLWEEVRDRLQEHAFTLSGGQQQRLCIARTLAIDPEIILMDEPTSALDPTATARIEQLIIELREAYTIIIVTHNMQQAARISDYTAFFLDGALLEAGLTQHVFNNPTHRSTEDYITGRFG